jgi:hypothetical protein
MKAEAGSRVSSHVVEQMGSGDTRSDSQCSRLMAYRSRIPNEKKAPCRTLKVMDNVNKYSAVVKV